MSEMEKILQNWDTADEYLNSKVEENKLPTFTTEEYERVKDSIPVGTKFIITDDEGGDEPEPSGDGRIVKTYDLVAGTQIPIQKNVNYPCHLFWSDSSTSMLFGEYAYLVSDTQLRVFHIHVSNYSTIKLSSSSDIFDGVYDETTGIFTISSSYTGKKLMI